jgi:hypothetical protein
MGDGMATQGKFDTGKIVYTPGALELLKNEDGQFAFNAAMYLLRHIRGDWGNVPPEDARENELSVKEGYRILSSYEHEGQRIWIITEADRSVTTFLLPSEY